MVGLVIPFLAALPAAFAAGGPICDPTTSLAACEAGPRAGWLAGIAGDEDDEPRYATQAVIDCPVPVAFGLFPGLVGECDGTPNDASYRASRDPESERANSSLRPARRDRTAARTLTACAGLPPENGDIASPVPSQPMALFALPELPPASTARLGIERSTSPPTRPIRPLERPPRA